MINVIGYGNRGSRMARLLPKITFMAFPDKEEEIVNSWLDSKMLSSRLVGHNWQNRLVTIVVGVRLDHHAAPSQPVAAKGFILTESDWALSHFQEEIPLEQLENPTMIQKAIIRFKGK